MTHPIPGADSERPLPSLPQPALRCMTHVVDGGPDDYFNGLQMAAYVHADRRAAAKVGANVAADVRALADKWNREAIAAGFAASDDAYALYEILGDFRAAGAPAETPKPAYESIDNQQFRNLLSRSRRTMTERAQQGNRDELVRLIDDHCRRQLAAQPSPAPIASTEQQPVAVVDDGEDGLFVEIILGEYGTDLKLGDKLYRHPAPIAGDVEKYVRTPEDDEIMPDCMPRRLAPGWQR
jgi:hypothetical protein